MRPGMKACVIFDTRYGNTEKIARSLEAGLKSAQVETTCMNEKDVTAGSLTQYDLICVGGPTHYGSASESIRNFLQSLEGTDLSGKMTFAFDTRRDSAFAGSAARFIEGRLRRLGSKVVIHRESAIIQGSDPPSRRESETKDEWKERRHRSETLKDGEEKRFQQIGASIGTTFSAKGRSLD